LAALPDKDLEVTLELAGAADALTRLRMAANLDWVGEIAFTRAAAGTS
jgi:hypothetical protein